MIELQGLIVGKIVVVVLLNGGDAIITVERVTEGGLFGTFSDGKKVFVPKHAVAAIEY